MKVFRVNSAFDRMVKKRKKATLFGQCFQWNHVDKKRKSAKKMQCSKTWASKRWKNVV